MVTTQENYRDDQAWTASLCTWCSLECCERISIISHKCYKTITATIESLSNTDARSQEQLTRTSAQVPKGFAYFHVRWSDGQGFAHIIENRAKFGKTFGLDVITGMLGLDVMNRRRGNCVTDEDIKNFTQRWNTVSDGM